MIPMVTFQSEVLRVVPWVDDLIDKVGFDPRSPYVERFWLSIIGPSTTWLMRRLASGFDASPSGFDLALGETARALGLGDKGGRHSPFLRTVNRMIQFELARVAGPDQLAVRRRLPPLSRRHTVRLSPALQEAHNRWQAEQLLDPPEEGQRRRARHLALSLLELGEDPESVERQLTRWRYHPALVKDAAIWATERHRSALAAASS
ncbi:MAG TPA: hypothetical protein VMO88_02990 [Acidimicrobiales bacterium]|nr:hypothetical protein [Acidimicrobiales bacterium]